MFERLIRFAIEQRIVVMIAVLIMAGIGVYSYQKLPIECSTRYYQRYQGSGQHCCLGYSPLETEQRITFPVETAMAGLPGLQQTRSLLALDYLSHLILRLAPTSLR